MLIKLLVALVIGGVSGFAANKLMKGKSDNIVLNVILGLVGGLVGGFLGSLIGIGGGWVMSIILSIAGSCLVVWLYRKFIK
ncbi:MAG: GlsB/YeaQ/YmgE family stress response membrane protein [Clostridia bacterium]|nr:GlsB/YeaQ/YmgE family stress response membrane protein [Clostridia bacterium]MBR7041750.1 GlsB/YeaQ/YmgE family stress response membrane protein [Clostridia bacterium]MCR4577480.1 GlsB/YeaQ/YmgE family stress response membrane protein [Clostridiales bacterium]